MPATLLWTPAMPSPSFFTVVVAAVVMCTQVNIHIACLEWLSYLCYMASEVIALHWTTNKGPYPRERRVIPVACNSLFQVRTKWNSCSPLNCCWYCSNLVYATVPSRDNRPHICVLAVFLLSSSFTPVPWVIDIGTMMYMYPGDRLTTTLDLIMSSCVFFCYGFHLL